jgi:hypothetical protein
MAPLGKAENQTLAAQFLEKDLLPSTAHEVRQFRKKRSKLFAGFQKEQKQADARLDHCLDAARLLEEVGLSDGGGIETETIRRYADYVHRCQPLLSLHSEIKQWELELKAREAYVSQSQLLHYLHSKRGRVQPRKLAKALAGLPTMNWRQSSARCYAFPATVQVGFNFAVLKTMLALARRLKTSILDSSQSAIQGAFRKLGNQRHASRRFFREHWRDLRLLIEELSSGEKFSEGELPYVLTSRLLKSAKLPKSRTESFLAKSEELKL